MIVMIRMIVMFMRRGILAANIGGGGDSRFWRGSCLIFVHRSCPVSSGAYVPRIPVGVSGRGNARRESVGAHTHNHAPIDFIGGRPC